MGLYLSHYKVQVPAINFNAGLGTSLNRENILWEDEFDDYDLNALGFARFVQDLPCDSRKDSSLKKGIYVKEIASMGSIMSVDFYSEFENNKLYTQLSNVEKAFTFIGRYSEDDIRKCNQNNQRLIQKFANFILGAKSVPSDYLRKENEENREQFRQSFLSLFEEGTSVFTANW